MKTLYLSFLNPNHLLSPSQYYPTTLIIIKGSNLFIFPEGVPVLEAIVIAMEPGQLVRQGFLKELPPFIHINTSWSRGTPALL